MEINSINLLVYFGIGVLMDIFVTLYYICIGHRWAVRSAVFCFLLTLIGYFVVEKIVVDTNWFLIFAYSFGCALGCFLTIFYFNKKM